MKNILLFLFVFSMSVLSQEIPLSPKYGGRSIAIKALEIGDIIVSTTNKLTSKSIRKFTNSEVSHALVYVGNSMVIEAIPGEGVREVSIKTALEDANLAVAFRYPDLTKNQKTKITQYARMQKGKKFGHMGIFRQAMFRIDVSVFCDMKGVDYQRCKTWMGKLNLGKGNDSSFFCSQLVIAAYQNAGIALSKNKPHWNSPNDIVILNFQQIIGYVGHLKTP